MDIGIIGSGNIGGTLTRALAARGHAVTVANSRGPETLADLAAQTGARPATAEEAAAAGSVVVAAVPLRAVPDLPASALAGKVLVDANNYYPGRDGEIEAIESGTPSSRWVAEQVPGTVVVKAFNTMQAQHLLDEARASGEPGRLAVPVAGDDEEAKRTVMGLVDALGFDPVDAGGLDDSWRQEPGAPVYGATAGADAVRKALAAARRPGSSA